MARKAPFEDRSSAGRALAQALLEMLAAEARAQRKPVVLALPRGGVPIAFEVSLALEAPLDVLLVRKIGAPGNPELGIGAVAEGGIRVLNEEAISSLLVSEQELEQGARRAEQEVAERMRLYRAGAHPISLSGRTAIVVDDGLATGGTARAAVEAAYERGAGRVILAIPVGAPSTVQKLREEADDVLCLLEPEPMWAIGMWYRDFSQVSDLEVMGLLAQAKQREAGLHPSDVERDSGGAAAGDEGDGPGGGAGVLENDPQGAGGDNLENDPQGAEAGGEEAARGIDSGDDGGGISEVQIPFEDGKSTVGDLTVPPFAKALVLFAHGSGSSRRSPRNREVGSALNERGIATLLFDLLTPEEELMRANVFDVDLLSSRLIDATRWAQRQPSLEGMKVGYFGASTGAAAALWAAAELKDEVYAVVSRGGRPDLASPRLPEVRAPVLLIVGGDDIIVLDLNRQALSGLRCVAEMTIVPGATHLFEEAGALEEVSRLAGDWFLAYLRSAL